MLAPFLDWMRHTKINEMKTEYLKNLLATFGENIKFDYNLKKEHGLILEVKQKIFYKAESLKDLINFLKKIDDKEKNIYFRCWFEHFNLR